MKRKLIIYISITVVLIISTIATITLLNEEELPRELTKEIDEILQENDDWNCDSLCYYETEEYVISKSFGARSFYFKIKTDDDLIQTFHYDYIYNELLLEKPVSILDDSFYDCSVGLFNRVTCPDYPGDITRTSQKLICEMIDYIDSILEDYKVS